MTIGILNINSCIKSEEVRRTTDANIFNDRLRNRINTPNVKRCLFGKLENNDTTEFLRNELKNTVQSKINTWNFDFNNDRPIEPSNYVWIKCNSSISNLSISEDNGRIPKIDECNQDISDNVDSNPKKSSQDKIIKYKQTTINQYWNCSKSSTNLCGHKSQSASVKRKYPEENKIDNNLETVLEDELHIPSKKNKLPSSV